MMQLLTIQHYDFLCNFEYRLGAGLV